MIEKHWFQLIVLLTIPSLAINAATLVVAGGLLVDLKKRDELAPRRYDPQFITDLMISTSRIMRQEQADSNAEIRRSIREYLDRLPKTGEADARSIR
ncbi:hypothetical protein ACWAUC_19705 [Bradyrhizobium guangdongense]